MVAAVGCCVAPASWAARSGWPQPTAAVVPVAVLKVAARPASAAVAAALSAAVSAAAWVASWWCYVSFRLSWWAAALHPELLPALAIDTLAGLLAVAVQDLLLGTWQRGRRAARSV